MTGTRRLLWWQTMAGGMGGFFGFYETTSSAYAGGPYPEPQQLRTHHTFWHEKGRLRLGMRPGGEDPATGVWLVDPSGKHFVIYAEDAQDIVLDRIPPGSAATAVAVDATREYQEIPLDRRQGDKWTWTAPYRSDWAVAVDKQ